MEYEWPILLYCIMCISDLVFFGKPHRSLPLRVVSRIAPQLIIVGCCMYAHGQAVGKANVHTLLFLRINKILWGSLFLMLANIYLHFRTLYAYNRVCVAIALAYFVILFSDEFLVFSKLNASHFASGGLIFAAVFVVACYVLRRSGFLHGILLVINCFLLSIVMWSAVLHVQKFYVYSPLTTVMGAFGAAFLLLSELLSVTDRYVWKQRDRYIQIIGTSCFFVFHLLTGLHVILSKD